MHKDLENKKQSIDKKEALIKCTNICSKAEYSVWDIREKLLKWGVERCNHDEIIEYLLKNNYINEGRYAECFVSEKFRISRWGRIKIGYALRQKRVAEEYISSAFETIDEELYFETLKELLKAKSKGNISDFKKRASIYNFAVSRGFESELINRVLREIEKDEN